MGYAYWTNIVLVFYRIWRGPSEEEEYDNEI